MPPASPERTTPPSRWPRDVWFEAVWNDDLLSPVQRVVAYAYARYAGRGDITWVPQDEMRKRTGISSRNAISIAVKSLIKGGWMEEVEKARQHRSARYRLLLGGRQMSSWRTSATPVDNSDVLLEDIPDVLQMNPDVLQEDTISQTDLSDLKRLGRAAPGPRREPTPSAPSNELDTSAPEVVNDQSNLATQLTTRVHAEKVIDFAKPENRNREECSECEAWLDRDGTCFVCRGPKAAPQRGAGP